MKNDADCARVHGPAFHERKQRCVGRNRSQVLRSQRHERIEALCQLRSHGNEPRLGKLRLADGEDVTIAIDIPPAQARNLADAQTELEQQAEDGGIGGTAKRSVVPILEFGGAIDELLGVRRSRMQGGLGIPRRRGFIVTGERSITSCSTIHSNSRPTIPTS